MRIEIIVALVALSGVFLSVFGAWIVSSKKIKAELRKIRLELINMYAGKLQGKRLDLYPKFYYLLSDFSKKLEYGQVTKEYIIKVWQDIDELNSKYSLIFGGRTGGISAGFRHLLSEISAYDDTKVSELLKDDKFCRNLKQDIGYFENALKNDLGIYTVEFSEPDKIFTKYKAVIEEVSKRELGA